MAEKIEMGLNTQNGFTKVDKNRKVKNVVGSEMVKLNSPVVNKTMQEIRSDRTEQTK